MLPRDMHGRDQEIHGNLSQIVCVLFEFGNELLPNLIPCLLYSCFVCVFYALFPVPGEYKSRTLPTDYPVQFLVYNYQNFGVTCYRNLQDEEKFPKFCYPLSLSGPMVS